MKPVFLLAMVVTLWSCYGNKEIQSEMVNAELIKIDTVYRYPNNPTQELTWRSADNVIYVNYVPIKEAYTVGSKILVMVRR